MSLKSGLAWRDEGLLYQIAFLANGTLALEAGNVAIAVVSALLIGIVALATYRR